MQKQHSRRRPAAGQAIQGSTQVVGLLGWPVAHSLSPQMHNAAFAALGLDWCYVPLPAPPDTLPQAVAGLRALGLRGANVTVPHKETVIPLLDTVDAEAQAVGAVNTVVVAEDGTLTGHNTDVLGIRLALEKAGFAPEGRQAIILGAGGAARAAAYTLLWRGARLHVLARRPAQAEALARDMRRVLPDARVRTGRLTGPELVQAARDAHLLVQATPVGMWPNSEETLWPDDQPVPGHLWVFDLVYRPRRTQLLRQAGASGASIIEGIWMLIYQAVQSFRLWTGEDPPLEVMVEAWQQAVPPGQSARTNDEE